MPFSKNQFLKNFLKRDRIINDFFISNYDTYVYDRKKISKYNPRAWWKYLQDWVNFKFSKYILSDTMSHFNYWKKLFGNTDAKHFVLPVLADTSIYHPIEDETMVRKNYILFYGSFIPLHGIDVILKSFALLEKDGIAFDAKIIGNGQTFKEMKKLYNQLNLKNVHMNGEFIDESMLADEIRKSKIILGIFGNSTKAKSVIPNKVYQSLASEKPLITMKSDTILKFFNEDDLLMCDNNPQALANAIKTLLQNQTICDSYKINGYKKFTNLFQETKVNFTSFIQEIDRNL